MNYIAEEILMCYQSGNKVAKDILMHYGTKRHSGRYPWGSGDNPYQHPYQYRNRVYDGDLTTFYSAYKRLRDKKKSEKEI